MKRTKKTVAKKPAKQKNDFYSPEAKAKRLEKRTALRADIMAGLRENNEVVGPKLAIPEKDLEWAEKRFLSRLSLKETEMFFKMLCICEETGLKLSETTAEEALAS